MEEDLKIFQVEYLSNHWLDLAQILNLSLGEKTKIKKARNEDDLQWRRPPMKTTSNEDDLKITKVAYLSNYWLDLAQILNLSSGEQKRLTKTKFKNTSYEDDLQWKTTTKY